MRPASHKTNINSKPYDFLIHCPLLAHGRMIFAPILQASIEDPMVRYAILRDAEYSPSIQNFYEISLRMSGGGAVFLNI
jgi:hypothetical protein